MSNPGAIGAVPPLPAVPAVTTVVVPNTYNSYLAKIEAEDLNSMGCSRLSQLLATLKQMFQTIQSAEPTSKSEAMKKRCIVLIRKRQEALLKLGESYDPSRRSYDDFQELTTALKEGFSNFVQPIQRSPSSESKGDKEDISSMLQRCNALISRIKKCQMSAIDAEVKQANLVYAQADKIGWNVLFGLTQRMKKLSETLPTHADLLETSRKLEGLCTSRYVEGVFFIHDRALAQGKSKINQDTINKLKDVAIIIRDMIAIQNNDFIRAEQAYCKTLMERLEITNI